MNKYELASMAYEFERVYEDGLVGLNPGRNIQMSGKALIETFPGVKFTYGPHGSGQYDVASYSALGCRFYALVTPEEWEGLTKGREEEPDLASKISEFAKAMDDLSAKADALRAEI